jgi:hypothetical protein
MYEEKKHKKCNFCGGLISKKNRTGVCKKCLSNKTEPSKRSEEKNVKKCICGVKIRKNTNFCKVCYSNNRRKIQNRPSLEELNQSVAIIGYVKTGQKYGVSDNAIRKWIKNAEKKGLDPQSS